MSPEPARRRRAAAVVLWLALAAAAALLLLPPAPVAAQTRELTAADRLALLYTSQLVFDDSGEPFVKIGIADGLERMTFTPQARVRVLPSGPGGAELELPAGVPYTVTLRNGQPGAYRHYVVLGRAHPGEREALAQTRAQWAEHAEVELATIELGSLFAIAGTMFDNREVLLVSQGFDTAADAEALRDRLQRQQDVELGLHTELSDYPTAVLELEGMGEGIVLRHQDLLWIDLGGDTARVDDVPTEKQPGKTESRSYAGVLVFTADRNGKLALVNGVAVETVLRGVVPAEIYASAPLEALKVQAIAARGTLISQIGTRHLADPYNLCDEQHCQVFAGMGATHQATDDAVRLTRGEILFHDKRIAETYYSANSGGLSASAHEVWDLTPRPYLMAHLDAPGAWSGDEPNLQHVPRTEEELREFLAAPPAEAFSDTTAYASGKHFRWTKTLTSKEVDELVAAKFEGLGRIQDVVVLERGPGMRVMKLEVVGSRGSRVVERELPVRRLFGGLKSGLFVVDVERDKDGAPVSFTFTGGGFGHGVGMCQTGAMGMALDGHDAGAILDHYYHGTTVRDLW